nr:toxin-activating lysine-acyltransferase [Sphingobium subterraneum]
MLQLQNASYPFLRRGQHPKWTHTIVVMVSAEVDAKIREQIKGGVFPIRLASDDWASGEALWLLDVIAPPRKVATAVLANFSQIAKGRPVAIHPVVARSVEPELLEKMKVRREGEGAGETQAAPARDAGDGAK